MTKEDIEALEWAIEMAYHGSDNVVDPNWWENYERSKAALAKLQPSAEPFLWWNPTDERALPPKLVKYANHPEDFTVALYTHGQPSAEVDEAQEREAFRQWGDGYATERARPSSQLELAEEVMAIAWDAWLARARSGKG